MSTIKCKDCGHENETQRVYCHSCGARLDRSALIEEAQKPQKPVKPRRNGQLSAALGRSVANTLKAAFFGFLVACIVQMIRPPKGAPSDEKNTSGDIIDAPSLALELEEASAAPRRFGYSEGQLNAYLKNRIKAPKNPSIPASVFTYDSSFVNLQPGAICITKKYLLFGLPCYAGGRYVPTTDASGLKLRPLGGHIGSLPLPGILFEQIDDFLFADYIKNMKEEATGAGKMKSIEVTPKMVVINSK